jgi:metal-responsive CopG/Arc/MetJ family transcriptional regulator
MKNKASISITDTLLTEIDKVSNGNRSDFIEKAIREYIAQARRAVRDKKDILKINGDSRLLNSEAMDVLGYQVSR